MVLQADRLNKVFRALSDPTRRKVLERLAQGEAPMTELARPFDMALPSFSQHLAMLEECGLVKSKKTGRVRVYQLAPKGLDVAESWLDRQRGLWERRLDQLDHYLTTLKGAPR
jgi:DNA-binding transcriptional ArsR family regulator